jgi:autotransporter-associated beta strand protein
MKTAWTRVLAAAAALVSSVGPAPAATLYWGGGTSDIADNTAQPADFTTGGDWSAGGSTPKNWANSPTVPNTYSVWANGANIANFGSSSATFSITNKNNIEAGGIFARQTNGGTRTVTLTDGGSNRTLTLSGSSPAFNLDNEGNNRLDIGNTLQLVAPTVKVATDSGVKNNGSVGGVLGFAGSATHNVDTFNLVSGGLHFLGSGTNSVKDTATVNVSGFGQLRIDRSETIGTLNVNNSSARITANTAASQVFQTGTFNRGDRGIVSFVNLFDTDARVRITGTGKPTNDVALPWAVTDMLTANAAFVEYDSTTDSFRPDASKITATSRDLSAAPWNGTYTSSDNVAYYLSSGTFSNALASDLAVNTLMFSSTTASQGSSDFNLGGHTLTTKAIALAGAGGTGSHVGFTNGNILASSTEDRLYIHVQGPSRTFSATIGKTGAADNTFDVVIGSISATTPFTLAGTNQYIGTMFIEGAPNTAFSGVALERSAASGDVVTGDLVLGDYANVSHRRSDQINDNGVVTLGENAFWGVEGNIIISETVRGIQGSGNVIWGESGNNTKNLTVNTAGSNYVFTGTLAGFDGDGGSTLTKTGTGTWTLSGSNTYNQATVISGGTLLVNGRHTNSRTNQGYTVNSGGTLGGTGSITLSNANVTVASGGKLSPGASVGALTLNLGTGSLNISNAVTNAASAALVFELGAPTTPGATYDQVVVSDGTVNIGTGVLEFDDFNFTFEPTFRTGTYVLFDTVDGMTGSLGSVVSGQHGIYNLTLRIDGTDLVLDAVAPRGTMISIR